MEPCRTVQPIGIVTSTCSATVDDDWDAETTAIRLLPPFDQRSVQGLEEFSHLEVIYLFDRVDPAAVHVHARRPRDNPAVRQPGWSRELMRGYFRSTA